MNNLSKVIDGAAVYLRPIGFLYGSSADLAVAAGAALVLAGTQVAFTHLEVIQRSGSVGVRRGLLGLDEWQSFQASLSSEVLARASRIFSQLQAPRPGLAAFSVSRSTPMPAAIMGIVNVTPDSFSDGGRYLEKETAIALGHRLVEAGADILDIGGVSTRPGAEPVSVDEEIDRVMPVIEGLVRVGVPLSVDTTSAAVMAEAVRAGAGVINDISALTSEEMSLVVARDSGAAVVLMHAQGDPRTMQLGPRYDDVLLDVYDYLEGRIDACVAAGISPERLSVDPGIGFGKTLEHNLALLSGLGLFHGLGAPLLVGVSRKSFIGRLAGVSDPAARLSGSLAAQLQVILQGAQIIRVHDVAEMVQAQKVFAAIMQAG